jgi:LacI family transcriptional regulator
MRELGLELGPILEGNSYFDGGLARGAAIYQMHPLPTAVVAMNDLTAVGVIKALTAGGLRVPEDISVTGFDGTQLAKYTTPSFTTVDLKRDFLGCRAADPLHDLFTSPTRRGQEYLLIPEVRLGESTGPPRNDST